jgi:hypothetical protein
MSEFDGMNETEARLLALEAQLLQARADFLALRLVVLSDLESRDVKFEGNLSAESCVETDRRKFLKMFLAAYSDEHPNRASKISRLLDDLDKESQ